MNFSQLARQFESSSLPLMKPASIATVKSTLKRLEEKFGGEPVSAITAPVLQKFFIQLRKTHEPKSIRGTWGIMRMLLAQAEAEGELAKIPKPKLPKSIHKDQPWFSVGEMRLLMAKAEDRLLITLLCETGLRIGEALGLQWPDIDLEARTLSVRRSVFRNLPQPPKTPAAIRTICLSDHLCMILESYAPNDPSSSNGRTRDFESLNRGSNPCEGTNSAKYVFGGRKPLPLMTALGRLHRLLAASGLPQRGFHAFRRGSITALANLGMPEPILAARAGHRLPGLTFGLYTQRTEQADRVWVEKLAEQLYA